jgi:hypothetical protein
VSWLPVSRMDRCVRGSGRGLEEGRFGVSQSGLAAFHLWCWKLSLLRYTRDLYFLTRLERGRIRVNSQRHILVVVAVVCIGRWAGVCVCCRHEERVGRKTDRQTDRHPSRNTRMLCKLKKEEPLGLGTFWSLQGCFSTKILLGTRVPSPYS